MHSIRASVYLTRPKNALFNARNISENRSPEKCVMGDLTICFGLYLTIFVAVVPNVSEINLCKSYLRRKLFSLKQRYNFYYLLIQ
jgi:hypothetical protein